MSLLAARDKFEKEKDKKDKDKKDKKDPKDKTPSKPSTPAALPPTNDPDELAAREALASGVWKEVKQDNGKSYFFDPKTKKTCWDLKKEMKKKREAEGGGAASPAPPAAADPKPADKPAEKVAESKPVVPEPQPSPSESKSAAADQGASTPAVPTSVAQQPPSENYSAGRSPAPLSAPVSSALPPNAPAYVDPVQRLLEHNEQLKQIIATGGKGQVALEFQSKYEAVVRANQALSVQLQQTKTEHDAMARALTEANMRIHELQMENQQLSAGGRVGMVGKNGEEEQQLTNAHLREQNRVLVTQISELCTLMARGLNENAARAAEFNAYRLPSNGADDPNAHSGSTLITRFLDSTARHTLCPNCILSVTRYRDKLINTTETNVSRVPRPSPFGVGSDQQGPVPTYDPVKDITSPPSTHYYNAASTAGPGSGNPQAPQPQPGPTPYGISPSANHQQRGYGGGHSSESPAVMYGGFVVRSPRVPG